VGSLAFISWFELKGKGAILGGIQMVMLVKMSSRRRRRRNIW
jgi:hypothetical protein